MLTCFLWVFFTSADVACHTLGYEKGFLHCCQAFGFSYEAPLFKDFQCLEGQTRITNCEHMPFRSIDSRQCKRQDYVAVTCYNGTRDRGENILRI